MSNAAADFTPNWAPLEAAMVELGLPVSTCGNFMWMYREGRTEMAQACFEFLPTRARLDLAGWADRDIFSHE